MQRRAIIGGALFFLIVLGLAYLLLDAETLTEREMALVLRLETDIANSLGDAPGPIFGKATRMTSKFQVGENPPKVYKLKVTSGRPGKRLTMDYSVQRTEYKAERKFKTRWKHELRAHRLGRLEPVSLESIGLSQVRLANIRPGGGAAAGVFFLAHAKRGLFSLTLKGITLEELGDFPKMIRPTLETLESQGSRLMEKTSL
jgi:hypothetical protein